MMLSNMINKATTTSAVIQQLYEKAHIGFLLKNVSNSSTQKSIYKCKVCRKIVQIVIIIET